MIEPFVALVLVDLLYAALGIGLTITALLAVMKGKAVRDAQARLSVAFGSPAFGDDATKVELLYAERRGTPTRRVALGRNVHGGRCYKPIVLRVGDSHSHCFSSFGL